MDSPITLVMLDALSRQMLPFDVILVGGNSAISGPIKNLTNSDYSHAMVYLGRGMVLEATIPAGVRKISLKETAGSCSKICILRYANRLKLGSLYKKAETYVGSKYSYKSLINYITGLFKERPKDEFTCAGLVGDLFLKTGHITQIKDNLSPEDFRMSSDFYVVAEHLI